MTAKTSDGREVFSDSKIYMPVPQQLGRGDRMGRGPYEKSGIIRDTSLPPHKTVHEKFEIPFPSEQLKKEGKTILNILESELNITVELWYMPFGVKDDNATLWQKVEKKVSVSKTGK